MSIAKAPLPRPRLNVRVADVAPQSAVVAVVVAKVVAVPAVVVAVDAATLPPPRKRVERRKGGDRHATPRAAYFRAYRARRKSEGRPLT